LNASSRNEADAVYGCVCRVYSQRPRNEEELAALKDFMHKSKAEITTIMTEAEQVRLNSRE
jgi:collagenase-like PrtC family protease